MGSSVFMLLLLLLVTNLTVLVFAVDTYFRADFPADFVFGSGASAYQVEGAAPEDGRTPSIWDTFAHTGRFKGGNGDKACNQYHKYKEDVQLMANMGLEAYRFSISWSRLIPYGRGPINPKGLHYYNNLINEIINNGIQPHVTLYHNDMPQALEDKYGGLRSRNVVKDFTAFADVCFREFGDRVLHWTTFNEANIIPQGGYSVGILPPGRCSIPNKTDCIQGNSSTEPYIVAHNILLAHASVAALYNEKYKGIQQGLLGLNVFMYWFIPYTNATNDVIATQRANAFYTDWFLEPLFFGNYPEIVRRKAGNRIPAFTQDESNQVKDSLDFLGVNHYTTLYVEDNPSSLDVSSRSFDDDMAIRLIGVAGGSPFEHGQFPVLPEGLYEVLEYLKQVYGNPPIFIHENGQQMKRNGTLNDTPRVEYIHAYIGILLDALSNNSSATIDQLTSDTDTTAVDDDCRKVVNGSNTKGYFTWSFLDSFELLDGYASGYGLYYVDLDDNDLTRYPKTSAFWYTNFLNNRKHDSQNGAIQIEKIISASSNFCSSLAN